ncbi:hypothetical protein [Novipirellula caenicola]|uniref:Uncharacterized protein n=1 Tax=Novipirellula caenicola TaxID=1536901 RepID=A0ABP9VYJ8_9BACT
MPTNAAPRQLPRGIFSDRIEALVLLSVPLPNFNESEVNEEREGRVDRSC